MAHLVAHGRRRILRFDYVRRAGWPWRLPTRAPTDPYVRTLPHTVHLMMVSPCSARPHARIAILGCDGDTCFRVRSLGRISQPRVQHQAPPFGFSFPPLGPTGPVPQLRQYYEGATTSCRPSRRASFPSLGGTSVALVMFAPRRTSEPPRPGVGNPVTPAGILPRKRQDLHKFLGNHNCPFAHVPIRLRQDRSHQTITVQQRGPWYLKSKGSHERSFEAQ